MKTWFDKNNNLHINNYPLPDDSENSPLFTAEYCLLNDYVNNLYDPMVNVEFVKSRLNSFWDKDTQRFYADPEVKGSHFSHDNMTGIACMAYAWNIQEFIDKVEIIGNSSKYLHPRDWIFYSYIKGNTIGKLTIWLLILIHLVSMLQGGSKDTSGKWLTLTRNLALMKRNSIIGHVSHRISTYIVNKVYKNSWYDVGKIYFQNQGHPNRELSRHIN